MLEPKLSYSQCGEDLVIDFLAKHILHIDEIYYLDLGSNHPVHFNNTYALYKAGHRGVSIDANPLFKKEYATYRKDDKFINCGVGPKIGKLMFYEIDPDTLSTFSEETALEYTKSGNHKIIKKRKVPVLTVEKIISKYCSKVPNLLSIDIEGLDYEILSGIDFTAWRPAIVCAETLGYSENATGRKLDEIKELLVDSGFMIYADTYINTIFVSLQAWRDGSPEIGEVKK